MSLSLWRRTSNRGDDGSARGADATAWTDGDASNSDGDSDDCDDRDLVHSLKQLQVGG